MVTLEVFWDRGLWVYRVVLEIWSLNGGKTGKKTACILFRPADTEVFKSGEWYWGYNLQMADYSLMKRLHEHCWGFPSQNFLVGSVMLRRWSWNGRPFIRHWRIDYTVIVQVSWDKALWFSRVMLRRSY